MAKTLLLADDSVTIQRVVELTFAHEDVRVVVGGDGPRAVQWLETERPDIVLVDVELPEVDGYGDRGAREASRRGSTGAGAAAGGRVRAGGRGAGAGDRLRRRRGQAVRAAAAGQPRQGTAGAAGGRRRGRSARRGRERSPAPLHVALADARLATARSAFASSARRVDVWRRLRPRAGAPRRERRIDARRSPLRRRRCPTLRRPPLPTEP